MLLTDKRSLRDPLACKRLKEGYHHVKIPDGRLREYEEEKTKFAVKIISRIGQLTVQRKRRYLTDLTQQ